MEPNKDPTHCNNCAAELNGFWAASYDKEGNFTSVLCKKCDKDKTKLEYEKTGVLTTKYILDTTIELARKNNFTESMLPLHDQIKYFEKQVWFNGLQPTVQKSSTKGMKAEAKDLKMLTYTICGRAMITLEEGETSITLITAEDEAESRMGLQSICATEKQAVDILLKACMLWRNKEDNGFYPKEDRMVGF